ncbi:MFS transporter, partial [Leifsonia sp. SIMBA_070]
MRDRARGPWWKDLRVPAAGHRSFLRIVVPAAPWVFAAAGVAYAIMPSVVEHRLGEHATLYATALTVITLGVG